VADQGPYRGASYLGTDLRGPVLSATQAQAGGVSAVSHTPSVHLALLGQLALALVAVPHAEAQDATVTVTDLTVDDQPPPEPYRSMMDGALGPHVAPVTECYRARLATRPGIAGWLRLRLWVSARQVIRVTNEESTLGDPELETCAMARVHEVTLPPDAPMGGARVRFVLRFATTTRAAAAPVAAPVPASAEQVSAHGELASPPSGGARSTGAGWSPPLTADVGIDRARGPLGAAQLLVALRGLDLSPCGAHGGSFSLRLSIRPDGAVRARPIGGTRDAAARRCLVAALESRGLGPQPGTTRAEVTIRFLDPGL